MDAWITSELFTLATFFSAVTVLVMKPWKAARSRGERFGTMTGELSRLARQEIQLAKIEMQEEGRSAARVGAMAAGAAAVAVVGGIVLALAGAWLLDQWMPRALAFLLISGLLLVVVAILAAMAQRAAKPNNPVPHHT